MSLQIFKEQNCSSIHLWIFVSGTYSSPHSDMKFTLCLGETFALPFLTLVLLVCCTSALRDCPSPRSISVIPGSSGVCSLNTSTCGSLQRALEAIAESTLDSGTDCIELSIPRGQYLITGQLFFKAHALHIVGEGAGLTSLVCDYQANSPLDYTWYFNWTQSIVLERISVLNCPLPLRLDTVSNLEISNCSFR